MISKEGKQSSLMVYHAGSHLFGTRRGVGLALTMTGSSSSTSVIYSTAVVFGIAVVADISIGSGVGNATTRVADGEGIKVVWVTVFVSVSYCVSEMTSGGSS
jgi:hypothetical protein